MVGLRCYEVYWVLFNLFILSNKSEDISHKHAIYKYIIDLF